MVWCYAGAQDQAKAEKLRTLVDILNTKDSGRLLAWMSDSCRIGNLPPMDNRTVIPEILSKLNPISSYEITANRTGMDGNTLISLRVSYQDGKSGHPSFTFNQDGYLINLGIIKARLKANPEKALAEVVNRVSKPDTIRVPFLLRAGLIYIPAKLNGRTGYFMFDSGAPVAILRHKYLNESLISKDVSVDFAGMGGAMEGIKWSTGNTVEWGGMQLAGLDAPAAPMNDMEVDDHMTVFGLLGYGVLEGYQVTFDYAHSELLLERVDEDGKLFGTSFDKGQLKGTFPMRMKRHIPIIDLLIDHKTYAMGIDCGANANVLQGTVAEQLASFIDHAEDTVQIAGVGAGQQNSRSAFLMHAKVGTYPLQDMYTVFTDQPIGSGTGDEALPIVGLLGTPFLNQQKTTLNFNKGEISFY